MVTISTKVGTYDVLEKDGKVFVVKNGKAIKTLYGVNPWDKDAIISEIEKNADELEKAAARVAAQTITPENVLPALEHIYGLLNNTISDNKVKGFVASRLKQVINKLAA